MARLLKQILTKIVVIRFHMSQDFKTSGPTLAPTVHQTMWWTLPAKDTPTTTSETRSSSVEKMRSSTFCASCWLPHVLGEEIALLEIKQSQPLPHGKVFIIRRYKEVSALKNMELFTVHRIMWGKYREISLGPCCIVKIWKRSSNIDIQGKQAEFRQSSILGQASL